MEEIEAQPPRRIDISKASVNFPTAEDCPFMEASVNPYHAKGIRGTAFSPPAGGPIKVVSWNLEGFPGGEPKAKPAVQKKHIRPGGWRTAILPSIAREDDFCVMHRLSNGIGCLGGSLHIWTDLRSGRFSIPPRRDRWSNCVRMFSFGKPGSRRTCP